MSNDLTLLNPAAQTEMTVAVENYLEAAKALLTMPPQQQAVYIRAHALSLNAFSESISTKISQSMLFWLSKVFTMSLWTIPLEDGVRYETFRDWVDGEIGPTFNKAHDTRPEAKPLLQDVVRIVERTIPYVMRNPVKDNQGEPITPDYLIENVGFGKLKITSSQFLDNGRSELRDNIIKDMTVKSANQLKKSYTKPKRNRIHAGVNFTSRGEVDMIIVGMSAIQFGLIRSLLGDKTLVEHQMHIRPEDREALLTLLPLDAQEQEIKEREIEDVAV